MAFTTEHITFMRHALRLAQRGRGRVEPNPMVGCVLVHSQQVVANGWHRRFGGPHAEVECLRDARAGGVDPSHCDMYVTLEPCCHTGKTPACTEAVIASRPGRVFVAMTDPDPRVSGKGIEQLRQVGLHVEVGLCEQDAQQLNEPFIKRVTTGLPWVILKWAQTLDGRIATATGHSQWISSATSRRQVHRLRARVDAIMVGIGTILADDARLTARDVPLRRQARRVVVDPQLRLPDQAAVLQDGPPVTLAISQSAARQQAQRVEALRSTVEILVLPPAAENPGQLDLRPLLVHLARQHQATNVLVEGGATLAGSLLAQRLVDQVLAFVAPRLLGDQQAIPAARGLSVARMDDALPLSLRQVRRFEDDMLLDYRVDWQVRQARGDPESPGRG